MQVELLIDKLLFCTYFTYRYVFVASGFEHSIANMFLIPLGIVIKNFAPAEFWTTVGASPEQFFKSNSIKFPR